VLLTWEIVEHNKIPTVVHTDVTRRRPSRRQLLGALAAGIAGGTAGCSFFDGNDEPTGTPHIETNRDPATGSERTGIPDRLASSYGTVVNIVEAGADHAGREPIDDVLASAIGADTLVYFPQGEYYLETKFKFTRVSDLGLVGDRALLRPPDGFSGTLFVLGSDDGDAGLRFEGIDFDFTAEETGARPLHAAVDDDLLVRNVAVLGRQDVDQDSMRFDVTDEDGTGRVENLRLPDGGDTAFSNTGVYVGEQSVGELSFVNCRIEGFPDNGLYASPATGPVHVEGGYYANNGIASVRVGGESTVRDVRVTCDTDRDLENMRGIRLRNGGDVLVENARVDMLDVPASDGAITMAEWLTTATIRDSHIRVDADGVPAINAKPLDQEGLASISGENTPTVEIANVTAVGNASDNATIQVDTRNRCLFENLCVHQEGPGRNGLHLIDSEGNVVRDSVLDVTGEPIVLDNASARRSDLSTARGAGAGGCR